MSNPIGSEARDLLVGTGITRRRQPLRRKLRERAWKHHETRIGDRVFVLWMDNYNRLRYSKNPQVLRNQTVNGTALAKLAIGCGQTGWTGHPKVKEMLSRKEDLAIDINAVHRKIMNDVKPWSCVVLVTRMSAYHAMSVAEGLRRLGGCPTMFGRGTSRPSTGCWRR